MIRCSKAQHINKMLLSALLPGLLTREGSKLHNRLNKNNNNNKLEFDKLKLKILRHE